MALNIPQPPTKPNSSCSIHRNSHHNRHPFTAFTSTAIGYLVNEPDRWDLYGIISVVSFPTQEDFERISSASPWTSKFLANQREILGSGRKNVLYFYCCWSPFQQFWAKGSTHIIISHYTIKKQQKTQNCLQKQIMRQTKASSNNFHWCLRIFFYDFFLIEKCKRKVFGEFLRFLRLWGLQRVKFFKKSEK